MTETPNTNNDATTGVTSLPPQEVTLQIPGRIHRDFELLTQLGVYLSVAEALRQAVIASWRHESGAFVRVRVDQADPTEDEDLDAEPSEA